MPAARCRQTYLHRRNGQFEMAFCKTYKKHAALVRNDALGVQRKPMRLKRPMGARRSQHQA